MHLAFLYCNYGIQEDQTAKRLLAALLRQLVEQCDSIPGPVETLYISHAENATPPSLEDIFNTLSIVISVLDRVFIVVDALDECLDRTRTELLMKIQELQSRAKASLLVTSRHINDIEQHFAGDARLEIRADQGDVEKYIGSQLVGLSHCIREEPILQEKIKKCIAETVDGM